MRLALLYSSERGRRVVTAVNLDLATSIEFFDCGKNRALAKVTLITGEHMRGWLPLPLDADLTVGRS
jgi:hypothetical protein